MKYLDEKFYWSYQCSVRWSNDYIDPDSMTGWIIENRKNYLILIMTPEKQDKALELSKHWSVDSTPARNELIMKRTYPVKLKKCDKICSNY